MLNNIRRFAQKNPVLRKLIGYHLASSGLFDKMFTNYNLSPAWQLRLQDVLSCPDNHYIPRVADAGKISGGKQIMHNGLKIHLGSYYGPEYAKMLLLNKGVHEPQEERIFAEAIKTLPENAVMIEMGAFWSFYSMWFNKEIKSAQNFMIEPDAFNMGQGKRNFRLNNMKGTFVQAFISKISRNEGPVKTICIDDFVVDNKLSFIHMLHSDIQGFEYEMLNGAAQTFRDKKVGYVFISTHSDEVHYQCLQFLKDHNFIILASADIKDTYSEDGLIAARAPYFPGIDPISIGKRSTTK
jgi:hypothetical protein